MRCVIFYTFGQLAALTFAQQFINPPFFPHRKGLHAPKLKKQALSSNLKYLHDGLAAHLPSVAHNYTQWHKHSIPRDCKIMVEHQNLSSMDIDVYSVKYNDCSLPWVLCRHKDSPNPLEELFDHFGKVPVGARQYVRHVVDAPDPSTKLNSAYNSNGNLMLKNKAESTVAVMVHETGHSLDGLGAYMKEPLSMSKTWAAAFALDLRVPDGYAQSNTMEDVAQLTVVAAFHRNVPGGIMQVQPKWWMIQNQLATLLQHGARLFKKVAGKQGIITGAVMERTRKWVRPFRVG